MSVTLFFKVLAQMEMNLRLSKNHSVSVKAGNSAIRKAYVTLWNFLIIASFFYFCDHQEGKAGVASEAH